MNYYVLITILVLAVIFILLFTKKPMRFTNLTYLSFIFTFFGIIAGTALSDRVYAYVLFGFGVIFAVLDIKLKPKK